MKRPRRNCMVRHLLLGTSKRATAWLWAQAFLVIAFGRCVAQIHQYNAAIATVPSRRLSVWHILEQYLF